MLAKEIITQCIKHPKRIATRLVAIEKDNAEEVVHRCSGALPYSVVDILLLAIKNKRIQLENLRGW